MVAECGLLIPNLVKNGACAPHPHGKDTVLALSHVNIVILRKIRTDIQYQDKQRPTPNEYSVSDYYILDWLQLTRGQVPDIHTSTGVCRGPLSAFWPTRDHRAQPQANRSGLSTAECVLLCLPQHLKEA
eukprot:2255812-Pleurochrysis_carterae.AAC.1